MKGELESPLYVIISGTTESRQSVDYGYSTRTAILIIPQCLWELLLQTTLERDRTNKQLALPTQIHYGHAKYAIAIFSSKYLKEC